MTYYLIMIMYIYIVCVFAWCALRMDKMWVSFSSTVTFRSFLFYFFFSSINTRNTQDGYPLVRRNSNSHEWGKQRLRFSSINHTVCEYMQWYPSKKRNHKCLGGGRQFDFCFFFFIIFHSLVKYENLEKCIAFGPGERLCVMRWCDVDMEPYCIERKKNFGRLPSNLHDCQITYTDRRQSSPNKTIWAYTYGVGLGADNLQIRKKKYREMKCKCREKKLTTTIFSSFTI